MPDSLESPDEKRSLAAASAREVLEGDYADTFEISKPNMHLGTSRERG